MNERQLTPFTYTGASVDVTPVEPVPLAGYASRRQQYRGVFSKLEGNAILLGANGRRVLFIAADVLYFGRELTNAITRRAAHFGLSSGDVILTASHTHFAPATDRTKPMLGEVSDPYARFIEDRLVGLVDAVMAGAPVDVSLEFSRGPTELNIGRRRRWPFPTVTRRGISFPQGIVMAPTRDAERDTSVEVIRVVGANQDVRAVFWKFACHPVGFPNIESVSSEFPGWVRDQLRASLGRDIPVVFWQGFAGDVRARIETHPTTRDRLSALVRGPQFAGVSLAAWVQWADELAHVAVSVASGRNQRALLGPLLSSSADVPMSALVDAETNPLWRDRGMRIQSVSFGSARAMFVGAEVCSPYLRLLPSNVDTIFVGYTGDVYGYLPSARQAEEGGYEGRDFFAAFGLHGRMRRGFEDAVLSVANALSSDSRAPVVHD